MTTTEPPRREPGEAIEITSLVNWYIPGLTEDQQAALETIRQKIERMLVDMAVDHAREIAQLQYDNARKMMSALHEQQLDDYRKAADKFKTAMQAVKDYADQLAADADRAAPDAEA